jgi:hypothetical protein
MAVKVVDMIPKSMSGETFQDSEPNLAVNPANPLQIAGSAFTVDPTGSSNAPIFVSTDGGNTWALNLILPSVAGSFVGTFDITLRFPNASGLLYIAFLRQPSSGLRLDVFRTASFATATPPTVLVDEDTSPGPDQPFIQAATQLGGNGSGRDHVYIGDNDRPGSGGKTSTIEFSNDAANATPPSPSGFTKRIVESRGTVFQDAPQIRPAVHPDGTVYAVYSAWRTSVSAGHTCDIVVVRDDSWATGATPFTDLKEPPAAPGDGNAGVRVAKGVTVPFFSTLGQQRIGGDVSIIIDPRDSSNVYLAWGDNVGSTYTLHVRRSIDRGKTWGSDIRTISNATNACLAMNSRGVLGFLYQQVTGSGSSQRWVTHFERTSNDFGTITDLVLSTVPTSTPAKSFDPYIGDYDYVLAAGKDFYGIFSANNTPDLGNFPSGVTFLRNVNTTTKQLLAMDGTTPVPASIDPFFFKVTTLEPNQDFYVRDWTDSAVSGDNGVEPSTHPYFFTTSDVWNRRNHLPGAFNALDQPDNQNPKNGPGGSGKNYAFSRIRRNASGTADTVTAKYLYSEFGTGSNYQVAGNPAGQSVPFGVGDLVLTAPPHEWHLDTTSSTHLCLAVQVSTASDPFVPPGLLGHAPGWPTTDLMVLNDNNKAQRNMGVYPASGSGPTMYFAVIHNAALVARDIELGFELDPEAVKFIRELELAEIGGRASSSKLGGSLVLRGMEPGENRWIRLTVPAAPKAKTALPVVFHELHDRTPVNGFAIAPQPAPLALTAAFNVSFHGDLLARAGALLRLGEATSAAREAHKATKMDARSYPALLKRHLGVLEEVAAEATAGERRDGIGLVGAHQLLARALGRKVADLPNVHANLLHALDARLTMLQKSRGDTADIVQTINWMLAVARRQKLRVSDELTKPSLEFVRRFESGTAGPDAYPGYMRKVLPTLEQIAKSKAAVRGPLESIRASLGHPAELQKAHREFVAALA